MQRRSHALLAQALLKCENGFTARRYEWAFLIGSVEPDCNPLTYLKGSLHCQKFGGHTYGNCRGFLDKRIRRLQRREYWTIWHYYTLGKLSHYVADAFTWPHNPDFPGGPLAHRRYEEELRPYMLRYLAEQPPRRRGAVADYPAGLAELHRQYLAEGQGGMERDARYILMASELLLACCRPVTEPVEFPLPMVEIGELVQEISMNYT